MVEPQEQQEGISENDVQGMQNCLQESLSEMYDLQVDGDEDSILSLCPFKGHFSFLVLSLCPAHDKAHENDKV